MKALALAAILFIACNIAPHARLSALCDAVRAGDTAAVRQLVAKGADPNAPSGNNDWTPLLHAIHTHQTASVTALLDAGADVNRAGHDGVTPLMMAAGYGYDDTVKVLLQRGAKPNVAALDWALTGATDIDRLTIFSCQDSTVRLLRGAAPALQSTAGARRWARFKRCAAA
jgi:ankyrin repeat protein